MRETVPSRKTDALILQGSIRQVIVDEYSFSLSVELSRQQAIKQFNNFFIVAVNRK